MDAGRRVVVKALVRAAGLAGVWRLGAASLLPPAQAQAAQPTATPSTREKRPPAAVPDDETAGLLNELILRRALDSSDPWVMMHVVLALGRDVKNSGGSLLDDVVATSVRQRSVDGHAYFFFEREVERHPYHFLQIFHATDVPYERVFVTPLGRATRRDLVTGAKALFDPRDESEEMSWMISVFTAEAPPDHDRFTTARGVEVSVGELVEAHCRDAESAYADTFAAMEKKKLYGRGVIQSKACNGTHLLYGLIDALRAGYTAHDLRPRVLRLIDATLFRVQAEPALIDAVLMKSPNPMSELNADAAKFTFLGHVLEDLGYAVRNRVFAPNAEQRALIERARHDLAGIVRRLTSEHDLDALQMAVPQAYKIVLGDACHALRGARFWL
jgi:hypothetical protein